LLCVRNCISVPASCFSLSHKPICLVFDVA
jgi:hypothetical protein